MKAEDKKPILDIAKRYAAQRQIIYSDHHEKLTHIIIEETIKAMCKLVTKQDIDYSMDLYGGQVPNTGIDYNKKSQP